MFSTFEMVISTAASGDDVNSLVIAHPDLGAVVAVAFNVMDLEVGGLEDEVFAEVQGMLTLICCAKCLSISYFWETETISCDRKL